MKNIAILLPSEAPRTGVYEDYPHGESHGIPMYALQDTGLDRYCCLVIGNHADQRHLLRCKAQLQAYLDAGGKIAFNGHVAYPFLDVLRTFEPTPEAGLPGLMVHNLGRHPIFEGVNGQELTFRKGVAGFYGRGCNPPPEGALVLTELGTSTRLPLDWLYRYPSGGQLLAHAGNDFLSFGATGPGGMAGGTTTGKLRTNFFRWAADADEQRI